MTSFFQPSKMMEQSLRWIKFIFTTFVFLYICVSTCRAIKEDAPSEEDMGLSFILLFISQLLSNKTCKLYCAAFVANTAYELSQEHENKQTLTPCSQSVAMIVGQQVNTLFINISNYHLQKLMLNQLIDLSQSNIEYSKGVDAILIGYSVVSVVYGFVNIYKFLKELLATQTIRPNQFIDIMLNINFLQAMLQNTLHLSASGSTTNLPPSLENIKSRIEISVSEYLPKLKFDPISMKPKLLYLVAHPSSDHNGALQHRWHTDYFVQLKKDYNIQSKIVSNANDICKAVSQAGVIDRLIILAHGALEHIKLNKDYSVKTIDCLSKSVSYLIRKEVDLISCSAGGGGFIYRLAQYLPGKTVCGSIGPTSGSNVKYSGINNPLRFGLFNNDKVTTAVKITPDQNTNCVRHSGVNRKIAIKLV